nr:uncharacterized protein LOC124491282 [Dermatophagoides farinae]
MQAKTTATTTTTMMMMMMKRPIKWSDFSLSADTLVKISKKIHIQIDDDKKCQNKYCTSNEQSQQQQQQEYQDETTWLKKFLMKMKNIGCQSSSSLSTIEDEQQQQFFLCKTLYRWLHDDQPLCGDGVDDNDDAIIKSTLNHHGTLYKFEYHIIYNVNYQAPVLYFHICDQDGRSVSLEWLWNRLPSFHSNLSNDHHHHHDHHHFGDNKQQKKLKNNINNDEIYQLFGNIITQINHPLFGHVVFMIHPCQTTSLMGQVLSCKHCIYGDKSQSIDHNPQKQSSSSNGGDQQCTYLITWLSSLASYIGLPMSLNYGKI